MTLQPGAGYAVDPPGSAATTEPALRWQRQLRCTCDHLHISALDADRVLKEQALHVGGIDLALHLNASVQQGEFYADCGRPEPWQEADICTQLLQEALSCDMPAITLALHPQSRHIVVKACLPLPAADDEGWLCTAMLLATVARAQGIKQRFALPSDGHR
ncbi:MAG: hypothetical protein RL522_1358 [Pseudomonadota bacterium]|jgi:hypothetical protein